MAWSARVELSSLTLRLVAVLLRQLLTGRTAFGICSPTTVLRQLRAAGVARGAV